MGIGRNCKETEKGIKMSLNEELRGTYNKMIGYLWKELWNGYGKSEKEMKKSFNEISGRKLDYIS